MEGGGFSRGMWCLVLILRGGLVEGWGVWYEYYGKQNQLHRKRNFTYAKGWVSTVFLP